ncbi:hypothetical protein [Zavarzinia sp. CC-PAN008]|uniref:hypothetical protein n=1 Tax=Zavarzinia sp. CC-PAN008 TaxID=3243332 RepID=UPI003F744B5F
MALFFDAAWFDARLAELGASRDDLANALQVRSGDLTLIFKDQRELMPQEVARAAAFFRVTPEVVVRHAGAGTLMPQPEVDEQRPLAARVDRLEQRIARLEADLARALAQLAGLDHQRR